MPIITGSLLPLWRQAVGKNFWRLRREFGCYGGFARNITVIGRVVMTGPPQGKVRSRAEELARNLIPNS